MNILVTTYWSYNDALIQTYTLPYLKIINRNLPERSKIYLLTLEQEHQKIDLKERSEIDSYLSQFNIELLPFTYSRFGMHSMIKMGITLLKLIVFCFKKNIKIIHSWCTPGGAIGYILSKLTRKILILDSYEPHAEPMIEAGEWKKNSIAFKILWTLEKLQSKRSNIAIACVSEMRRYAQEKFNADFEYFYVKPACIDFNQFSYANRKRKELLNKYNLEDKIIGVYAGKFGGSYLSQEVFDFFSVAEEYWGDRFRLVMLNNHSEEEILRWCEKAGLSRGKVLKFFVPHSEVADYIGLADFAITPFIPVPSKRYGTPIKTGEYLALGLPVVITENISDDSEVIEKNGIGSIMRKFDKHSYLQNLLEIENIINSMSREDLYLKIRAIAEEYRSFSKADRAYNEIYGKLLAK
ncbi:glycosyltransferase [Flammeovirga sp. SubArs3]|uniref:glycosyltransferase n=1 Tax=Flammeovirga sp. SubArs3 TaxID=2995316 RepID=UPI00248AB0A7|nr:glycosyltransferase [Flammeovirga sp. SubArs3]